MSLDKCGVHGLLARILVCELHEVAIRIPQDDITWLRVGHFLIARSAHCAHVADSLAHLRRASPGVFQSIFIDSAAFEHRGCLQGRSLITPSINRAKPVFHLIFGSAMPHARTLGGHQAAFSESEYSQDEAFVG